MRSYVLQSTNYCELDWGRRILWGKGDMKDTHIEPSFHKRARLKLWSCVSKNGQSQGSWQGWTSTHQSPREDGWWVDGKNFSIWFLGLQYCRLTYFLLAYYLFWRTRKTFTKFLEARFSFKNTLDATMALLCKSGVAKFAIKYFCIGIVKPFSIHIMRIWSVCVCGAYFSSSQIFYKLRSLHFQFISLWNKSMQIVL